MGFLKYLNRASFIVRLHVLWLKNFELDKRARVGRTAVEFYDWAKGQDDLIRKRGYKYRRPLVPSAVRAFAKGVKTGVDLTGSDDPRVFMR